MEVGLFCVAFQILKTYEGRRIHEKVQHVLKNETMMMHQGGGPAGGAGGAAGGGGVGGGGAGGVLASGGGGGGLADNKAALAAQLKESGFFGGHLGLGMMGEEESKPKMMEESSHGGYPQIGDSYDDEDDDEDDEIDDDEDGEVGEENEEGMGKITSLDREEENLV